MRNSVLMTLTFSTFDLANENRGENYTKQIQGSGYREVQEMSIHCKCSTQERKLTNRLPILLNLQHTYLPVPVAVLTPSLH